MRLFLLMMVMLLLGVSCTATGSSQQVDSISIQSDTFLLKGIDTVFPQLAYLQHSSESLVWFGNLNGQLIGCYDMVTDSLKIVDISSEIMFDTIYSQGNMMAVPVKDDLPILAKLQCSHSEDCIVAYYKDYLLYHQDMPYLITMAFVSTLDNGGILSSPQHIEHPNCTPWDTTDLEVWAGIDASVYRENDRLYTNFSGKFEKRRRVVNGHKLEGVAWLADTSSYLLPDSQLFVQQRVYIMANFTGNGHIVLVNDGKQVVSIPDEQVIVPSNVFKAANGNMLGEIIMDTELHADELYLLTGEWSGSSFDYTFYSVPFGNTDSLVKVPIVMHNRPYSYNIFGGRLHAIEKTDAGYRLLRWELITDTDN